MTVTSGGCMGLGAGKFISFLDHELISLIATHLVLLLLLVALLGLRSTVSLNLNFLFCFLIFRTS